LPSSEQLDFTKQGFEVTHFEAVTVGFGVGFEFRAGVGDGVVGIGIVTTPGFGIAASAFLAQTFLLTWPAQTALVPNPVLYA
jgi:hypothetical protein